MTVWLFMKRLLFILSFIVAVIVPVRSAEFRWIGSRWWGISVSYSQKWYSYSSGGERHWVNFWGEGGNMQGVQFGIPVQPVFRYGLGLSSGVFCEIYSCRNKAETSRIEDVALYFPLHAMWRHDLNSKVSLHVTTGPGLTVGMVQRVIDPTDSQAHQYYMKYNDGSPRRVNFYWEAGAGVTVGIFRFNAVYSIGLTPSRRYLSTMGAMTHFYAATPTRLTFSAALVF